MARCLSSFVTEQLLFCYPEWCTVAILSLSGEHTFALRRVFLRMEDAEQ